MKQQKTVEDYLKTIYILYRRSGLVRGVDVAEELSVSRATVSISLKGLEEEGYLFVDEAHGIHLTEKGRRIAEETYERYRTFQELLEGLGVDKRTAGRDACRMEHAVSPESFQALKGLAGKAKRE
ncbi:MAG TPA: metal-dependent transcriptional regulator [Firmicutes bacterium]|nr:metal-dependent transcriptional regulator [Bacillota bacterium]